MQRLLRAACPYLVLLSLSVATVVGIRALVLLCKALTGWHQ